VRKQEFDLNDPIKYGSFDASFSLKYDNYVLKATFDGSKKVWIFTVFKDKKAIHTSEIPLGMNTQFDAEDKWVVRLNNSIITWFLEEIDPHKRYAYFLTEEFNSKQVAKFQEIFDKAYDIQTPNDLPYSHIPAE
jgi:hypothetical protein